MNFKKIVVAGGGVLGVQIAFQTAMKGFDTTIWLRSEGSIERTRPRLAHIRQSYIESLQQTKALLNDPRVAYVYPKGLIDDITKTDADAIDALLAKVDQVHDSMKLELDPDKAFSDADLVIESVSENKEEKAEFYTMLAPLLPEHAVVVSNSSTMLPSDLAPYTGRPEKFLHLHFANRIWAQNIAEIMGHEGTEQKYYDLVVEFAEAIGMLPIKIHKEQPGYVLNSLLVPFLDAALSLAATDVADPHTIDLTWERSTGAPMGPFKIYDIVGLKTAYEITSNKPGADDPDSLTSKKMRYLKDKIDRGELGVAEGKGFYDYE